MDGSGDDMDVLRIIVLALIILSGQAFAATSKCLLTMQDQAKNALIELTPIGSGCGIYITPLQRDSMVYRSYLFTDDGLFQIFNSFGNGAEQTKTGARVYAIFPRNEKIGFHVAIDQNSIRVQTSNRNTVFKLSTTPQVSVQKITNSDFLEDQKVQLANNGGLELSNNKFVYLDIGFGRGAAPQSNAESVSTFHDRRGRQCVVRNRDVFHYLHGDATLKSDAKIRTALAKYCPKLQRF
jgi:hypothetical protein